MADLLQRFLFDDTDIRGELVRLDKTYCDTLKAHQYPEAVKLLLGEFLAAAALLSVTLKFEGRISLQARSNGEIPLIMAEASSKHTLRAIARGAEDARSSDFKSLLEDGLLTITIEPKQGKRYQGIVAIEGNNLAQCLEAYFRQSEQLSTRIWLHAEMSQSAGMMLQQLPGSDISASQRPNDWEHIVKLTETITSEELLNLKFEELLFRLYNQEKVTVFDSAKLAFHCNCSRDRTLKALITVGEDELKAIILEQGSIATNCEFCHQHYDFNTDDIKCLFHPRLH